MDIQKYSSDFSAESLRKGYINNILERNPYIHNFILMLLNVDKGGVIAIDGEWGSGKTYFVHQVKWLLDSANENIDSDIKNVLVFNVGTCVHNGKLVNEYQPTKPNIQYTDTKDSVGMLTLLALFDTVVKRMEDTQ